MKKTKKIKYPIVKDSSMDVKYMNISSSKLQMDETYQRPLSESKVNRIVRNFDPKLVNAIKVSCRDGSYWVYDGQHTLAALKACNGGKHLAVPCAVRYGLTQDDEARLFLAQNGISSNVGAKDKIRARNNFGDEQVVDMMNACDHYGYTLNYADNWPRENCISAVKTLKNAHTELGPEGFREMLSILRESWGSRPDALKKPIIQGVSKFIQQYGGEYDHDRLVQKLGAIEPVVIVRDGKAHFGAILPEYYSLAILKVYNTGRGKKLKEKLTA